MTGSIAARLKTVRDRIDAAAIRANRQPGEVKLLAVSKTKPAEMVVEAILAGHYLFGENRFQEAPGKITTVREVIGETARPVEWHFIGHLQSNKVRKVLEWFDLIESVDSQKLLNRIDQIAGELEITARCLLQINISGAESQYGIDLEELDSILEQVSNLDCVRVEGLMAIGPLTSDEDVLRSAYGLVRQKAELIRKQKIRNVSMDTLSLGMSGDFEIAIEEGATIVRIGTMIFGSRE